MVLLVCLIGVNLLEKNSKKYGDTYYDLAKLRHGLLVNHGIVNLNNFTITELAHNYVFISIRQHSNLIECIHVLDEWMKERI